MIFDCFCTDRFNIRDMQHGVVGFDMGLRLNHVGTADLAMLILFQSCSLGASPRPGLSEDSVNLIWEMCHEHHFVGILEDLT